MIAAAHTAAIAGWDAPVALTGDPSILAASKTAFFCSRKYPAAAVMPALNWAEQMRDSGQTVVSGFHSLLETQARDILLLGDQPLIWTIARAPYATPPQWAKKALAGGRLLVIAPANAPPRPSAAAASLRNQLAAAISQNLVAAHIAPNSSLNAALSQILATRPITRLA